MHGIAVHEIDDRISRQYSAEHGGDYFGTQNDPNDPAMLMMIDYGVFYEFIPLEDVGKENPRICCLEEVELNKNYAMVISLLPDCGGI